MAASGGTTSAPSNIISGKILHKESGNGVADLLVELFDLDSGSDPETENSTVIARTNNIADALARSLADGDISGLYKMADRMASGITDTAGKFSFEVTPKDFNLPRQSEQKPDLVLLVLAPDEPGLDLNKRLLHFTRDVRLNAGSREAYIIKLPTELLTKKEIPFSAQLENSLTTKSRVDLYVDNKAREIEYNSGVAEHHAVLATKEGEARKIFRNDIAKELLTDFSAFPLAGVFAAEGESIKVKNAQVLGEGVIKLNAALGSSGAAGVPINLYLSPEDKVRLALFFTNPTADFVEIPDADARDILFKINNSENPGTLLLHNNPIANYCNTESAAQKCATEHSRAETEPDQPIDLAVGETDAAITEHQILSYTDRLLKNIPSPDMVLRPELIAKRSDKTDIENSVNDFSLQKGPAEVPAFYDFNSLQIAFEHVWKQLFDETIPNLAYTVNNVGRSRFGIDNIFSNGLKNGLLSTGLFFTISPVEVPPIVVRFFDISKEEYNDMSYLLREQLVGIASSIKEHSDPHRTGFFGVSLPSRGPSISDLRIIQSLTEQGERLIDTVRHDDYYTLHKTLRDLNARLTGKYEFTVFAADKDYHSVNFGLLNTYRQQWTPLMYQAGRLIKTMALSPKEERKYSVKTTRNEKRSSKEAKKNNSSITNEQSSTSRVEAEIMAKAQNKTNFGLNTEGEFNVGAYQGKATTTFGVEAASESSQTRKDFREAVLKAVQDYKNETSTEVTTESEFLSETNESGTITNSNDELAVTYLFYELQKRYRVSEEIYRVMPVILVAQEVPSPDHITPAWVLSNDWILNRQLLDDSFRPTLRYIANNSVGDDFSLRELRKNLRQQRNLVDTLRIEFSSASLEADNRYKALEMQIVQRINEEHAENSDGLFSDIVDTIGRGAVVSHLLGIPGASSLLGVNGGGGPDPDAAKARELAAKDAHQYALEKAEKISTSLKQEMTTLHTLTDQYNKTLQARLDNETKVKRLLVHIRNNIFYYMQAIWSMEPPDQRYMRLHKVRVPILELESRSYRVKVASENPEDDIFARFREPGTEKHKAFLHGKLKHNVGGSFDTKSLVEVADLDSLLGFKGNYMIFPMKEHNALTEFMAAPYIDTAFGAMDPDEMSNVNLEEYSKYVCCLHKHLATQEFEALKPQLKAWLDKLLATPLRNGDEIVVPTGSLFVASLVDPNPVLEDFKLKHRELDVFKVQEEVRKAGLENIRLAARLLNDERDDPDIEKKIVVQGAVSPTIDVDDN